MVCTCFIDLYFKIGTNWLQFSNIELIKLSFELKCTHTYFFSLSQSERNTARFVQSSKQNEVFFYSKPNGWFHFIFYSRQHSSIDSYVLFHYHQIDDTQSLTLPLFISFILFINLPLCSWVYPYFAFQFLISWFHFISFIPYFHSTLFYYYGIKLYSDSLIR